MKIVTIEWKYLGNRMEESETQILLESWFSAGKLVMNRAVIFACMFVICLFICLLNLY